MAVREGILRADPGGARAQRAVGVSHEFTGYTLSSQHDYLGAADEHRKALALFERVAKVNPHFSDIRRQMAVAQENLCESLALGGAAKEAVGHCEQAIGYYGAMVAADPKDIQALEDLADGESTMSVALDLSHSPRAALEHQEKARRLFASAMSTDPEGRDVVQENALSLMELAKLRKQLHLDGAAAAAEQAVRILQGLIARSPQSREIGMALERAQAIDESLR